MRHRHWSGFGFITRSHCAQASSRPSAFRPREIRFECLRTLCTAEIHAAIRRCNLQIARCRRSSAWGHARKLLAFAIAFVPSGKRIRVLHTQESMYPTWFDKTTNVPTLTSLCQEYQSETVVHDLDMAKDRRPKDLKITSLTVIPPLDAWYPWLGYVSSRHLRQTATTALPAGRICMLICLVTVSDECPPHSLSPPCGSGQSTLIPKFVPVASFARHWHAFNHCAGVRFTWLSYPRVRGRDEFVLARGFVPAETVVVSGPWLNT
ncbi:uncharacterized protein BDZ83DRAFT_727319 [Colletotrichum acutatum]|uniref:Uncharacterized protein n=1 Tax=Glomerella acutata TaxID=27357 RepID=A0AAD9D0B5_GLOAC|nr:uncharacterized protein BDZ83DRAFT_727319 [Colletotrichum acutatum]KAK1729265.1 hypothetical protein BDZ83DRAFT_727319 [Colletotrichum acutatum]